MSDFFLQKSLSEIYQNLFIPRKFPEFCSFAIIYEVIIKQLFIRLIDY